jgi:hypothetical protein
MADALTGRRPAYLEQYAAALTAAYRVERLERDVQKEQDRIQYLDSLIAQQSAALGNLRETFRVAPTDLGEAKALLRQMADVDTAVSQAERAGQAAKRAAARVPPEERSRFVGLLETQPAQAANSAVALLKKYPGAASKIMADVNRYSARLGPNNVKRIEAEAARARAPQVGVPTALAARAEEAKEAFSEALESAVFAGADGIRGGYEGLALVNLREMTADQLREQADLQGDEAQKKRLEARAAALDDSDFATGQDALDAALAVVRATGNPAEIEQPLARTMYEEARARQAYRNDQRADFEQEVLDARRRLATLEQEKTKLAGAYDDPRQEVLRRDLRARGYKVEDPFVFKGGKYEKNPQAWRNKYIMQQGTPEYDYFIQAHERRDKALAEDKPLAPSTRGQNLAVQYTMMRQRRGESTNPQQLATQLQKAGVKGKDLTDAVSFAMAYWNLGGPNQDPESLKLRKEDDARKAQEEEDRRKAATAAAKDAEEAREAIARQEREMVAAVTGLRTAQAASRKDKSRKVYVDEYKRQMAMGATREDAVRVAREKALAEAERAGELAPDTAGPASRVLMGTEALMERQAAPAPARGFTPGPEQEVTFMPGAVRSVDPTNPSFEYEQTPEGYKVFVDGVERGVARAGTTPFNSIERVLGGGTPLPRDKPKPAAPAPAPEPEAPAAEVLDFTGMSDEEVRKIMEGKQ